MKKFLVLCVSAAMLLSTAAASLAATTTYGGNVRVWYLNTDNGGSKDNTFNFDRLEITSKTQLTEDSTLNTDFQGRTTNKTVTKETHFFVDKAYYTKNNLFVDGGKLMVGAFDGDIAFKNGFGTPMLTCGLGDGLKIGQSLGVAYAYANDKFGAGLGMVNANTGSAKNDAGTDPAGYSFSGRFEYKPFDGFKAGVGYASLTGLDTAAVKDSWVIAQKDGTDATNGAYSAGDSIKVPGTAAKEGTDQKRMVIDASYKNLDVTPFSGLVEYAKVTEDTKDDIDGIYVDVEYTFADKKATAYLSYGDGDIYGNKITSAMGTFKIQDDNYTCAGLLYNLSDGVALQGEYAKSGNNNDGIGIRLKVSF